MIKDFLYKSYLLIIKFMPFGLIAALSNIMLLLFWCRHIRLYDTDYFVHV